LQTRHFRIKMTMTTTGCCGDSHLVQEREVWMAPELPRLVCPLREGQRDYSDRSGGPGDECKVKVTRSGDLKLYDEAMQGEAVKEILYMDGKPLMTTELVEYSKALLEDSLFSLDGLRKVSSEEFESQKQQQMMKSIMQQSNP